VFKKKWSRETSARRKHSFDHAGFEIARSPVILQAAGEMESVERRLG
jgi:hypothetical protein